MIVPSLSYDRIITVLRRAGWVVVLQKGCHIRLQKQTVDGTRELTVPALRPVLRSTLVHVLAHAQLTVDALNDLL